MIRNRTRGTVLCKRVEKAESMWQRTKGLMFRKELHEGQGLLMEFSGDNNPGIWMLGMRFPIDIIFIDSKKEVLRIVEKALPIGFSWRTWRVFHPPVPAKYVLEVPGGSGRSSRTLVGDRLEF